MKANLSQQIYPYLWLDDTIEVVLNPARTNLAQLRLEELREIEHQFTKELEKVYVQLKTTIFLTLSDKKIRIIISHYYDSLLLLEKKAKLNLIAYQSDRDLSYIGENLLDAIQININLVVERYHKYLDEPKALPTNVPLPYANFAKLFVRFSVDQFGILLKAACESKLIVANSLSLVCRLIVPFLSTEKMKTVSWNSMRKSTYQIEQSDKVIVIAALEKLITIIKNY